MVSARYSQAQKRKAATRFAITRDVYLGFTYFCAQKISSTGMNFPLTPAYHLTQYDVTQPPRPAMAGAPIFAGTP
jgi:hypothetical protein